MSAKYWKLFVILLSSQMDSLIINAILKFDPHDTDLISCGRNLDFTLLYLYFAMILKKSRDPFQYKDVLPVQEFPL